jgi:2-isopropylmalate synthase
VGTSELKFDWNTVKIDMATSASSQKGVFFDETLRDGIQAPYISIPSLETKLQLIDLMARSGIQHADLGFPGSGTAAAKQCQKIASHIVASGHSISQGYAGRCHTTDINAICTLAQVAGVSVDAYIFIGVSPIRQYLEDWDINAILARIRSAARECEHGDVEFVLVLEDTTRCTPDVLRRIYDVAIDLGIRRITLCDTVGASQPNGTKALILWSSQYFAKRGHSIGLEWHGHNDRGLALINALIALEAGCERVHGTVLGIGERAGNASIDQLIVNSHLNGYHVYDLIALRQYCEYASTVLDFPIPGNYPAMGRDVFTTSAGVHASAILKAHTKADISIKDSAYSSIPASYLGREQQVLIDSASGTSNVQYWLAIRGRMADDTAVQKVLEIAKTRSAPLKDDEIENILASRP